MKKNSVKTISFLLALFLIMSLLGACAGNAGSTDTASLTTDAEETIATETKKPAESTTSPISAETSPSEDSPTESTQGSQAESGKDSPAESTQDSAAETTDTQETEEPTGSANTVLVIYFSHTGTTKEVAAYLHELVGGDLAELIPEEAYPEGYSAALDPAKQEQRENARPAIKDPLKSIDQYEVIYLGYPIWWGTVPMIINTFLESYDFTGKTVVPFATSGGTGIGQSVEDIRSEVPDAEVPDGLLVRSNDDILPWLQVSGLVQ